MWTRYPIEIPPLMLMFCPVMNDDSSLAKNTTAPATDEGRGLHRIRHARDSPG
jgi:hypothetical protein